MNWNLNTNQSKFVGLLLLFVWIMGPLMGFPVVSAKTPQFGERALKINGRYVSPEIFKEERSRFFMRWRRNSEMLRKSDEERNDLLLEEIINRVIIEDYLYNRAGITVTSRETDEYINRYIKPQYNTAAKMNAYLEGARLDGMAGLKKNIDLYLRKLKCFSKIAKESGISISPQELENLYQNHVKDNRKALIRHILVRDPNTDKARQKARDIHKQLKNGVDFGKLAAQHSADAETRDSGGLLEPISRRESVPEVAEPVFNAKAGDLLPPIKTRSGYEIIRVEKFIDFFHPKAEFADMVLLEKFGGSEQFKQWLAGIKSKYKIEILDPAMKAYRLYREGKLNQAGSWYEKAYEAKRDENYLIRALESYQAVKKWPKLIKLGQTGIRKYPAKVSYYLYKAEGLHRTGKVREALDLMKKSENLSKGNTYLQKLVAEMYARLGYKNEAARINPKAAER